MLLQFKFTNFRSFADETVFNMTAAPIREHKNSLIERNGVQVLPVAVFYGANASGKTSFFMALYTMCSLVLGEKINNTNNQYFFKEHSNTFIFDDSYNNKPTEYEICLAINNNEYRYGFECSNERIINEYLYIKKLSKNNTVEKILFERTNKIVISRANANIKKEIEYCASMCVDDSLLLTDLGRRKIITDFDVIYTWFDFACYYYKCMLKIFHSSSLTDNFFGNMFNYDELNNTQVVIDICKNIENFITTVDNSIVSVRSIKKESDKRYTLLSLHQSNNKNYETPFFIESDGTKRLLSLSYFIFIALNTGHCCIIDELDLHLHPLLLRKIIRMFKDKDINKNGAQLIFSAHNIINLDSSDLRRDEVWFVEKNNHKSTIFSLYDFEDEDGGDIRSDLDYGKHYLLGRFGAIPFQDKGGIE